MQLCGVSEAGEKQVEQESASEGNETQVEE